MDNPLGPELRALGDRLARARAGAAEPGHAQLVQDLETAYEELRVADEEVRAQQEQIAALVHHQESQRAEHERLLAVLPVAVVVTDRHGLVRRSNAAAAALAGRHPGRMEGKPVFGLFAPADRPALRSLLARAGGGPDERRETGVLLSRTGDAVPVEVSVSAVDDERGLVSWVLLTTASGGPTGAVPLAEGLARLAALSQGERGPEEAVRAAVAVCHEVLGDSVELTVQLGPCEEPELVASSGQRAQALDAAQLRAEEGPTFSAYRERRTIVAPAPHAVHWPAWAGALPEREKVAAVVAVPLEVSDQVAGVLTAYAITAPSGEGALVESVETLGLTVRALLQEFALRAELDRAGEHLERALASRAVIDQAKGIVMAKRGCSAEQAFHHLVDIASTRHVKLREVAAEIVGGAVGDGH